MSAGAEAVHGIDFDQASRRASKVAMANAAGNGRKVEGAGCLGLLQEHWETLHLSESGSRKTVAEIIFEFEQRVLWYSGKYDTVPEHMAFLFVCRIIQHQL